MSMGLDQIQVDKVIILENLKVGLIVTEQRKRCASGGYAEEFYELGFAQSRLHVPPREKLKI